MVKGAVKLSLKVIITIIIATTIFILSFLVTTKGGIPFLETGKGSLQNFSKNATQIWPW